MLNSPYPWIKKNPLVLDSLQAILAVMLTPSSSSFFFFNHSSYVLKKNYQTCKSDAEPCTLFLFLSLPYQPPLNPS